MRRWIVPVTLVVVLVLAVDTRAAVIATYDVANARESGFGSWAHVYDKSGIAGNTDGTFNYSGGSGTLNDGLLGTSHLDTQLFYVPDFPSITLHLDHATNVSEIKLFSFDALHNRIPGNLASVDVTIGGVTVRVTTAGFGPATLAQSNANELRVSPRWPPKRWSFPGFRRPAVGATTFRFRKSPLLEAPHRAPPTRRSFPSRPP
jgi:hypothetical protein